MGPWASPAPAGHSDERDTWGDCGQPTLKATDGFMGCSDPFIKCLRPLIIFNHDSNIIWGQFMVTFKHSFVILLKTLGGWPHQTTQKSTKEQASIMSGKTGFPPQELSKHYRFSPITAMCGCVCVRARVCVYIYSFLNMPHTDSCVTAFRRTDNIWGWWICFLFW